jgi:hypothetical protein
MFIHVTKAVYIDGYRIYLEFNNGEKGIADLELKLDKPVFEKLKNIDYFKSFQLEHPTIQWPNNTDLAPESLLELIKTSAKQI